MKRHLSKRWVRVMLTGTALLILLFIFRFPILRGFGNHLIDEDPLTHSNAIAVLGGNSVERGLYAAHLYDQGIAPQIICTGGNIPGVLEALDTTLFEAEITKQILVNAGIPAERITILTESTSTFEESEEIFNWCHAQGIDTITIVSSRFHTRRVRNVFESLFDHGTTVPVFSGAPSTRYDESEWWKSEEGLIMVNNEYMKLLYYLFKY
ncbi:MAG: YdcF family protein [Flavobacteriales bacterium]|nr:YdcF family protein [Flavobacteriales bacterium]